MTLYDEGQDSFKGRKMGSAAMALRAAYGGRVNTSLKITHTRPLVSRLVETLYSIRNI